MRLRCIVVRRYDWNSAQCNDQGIYGYLHKPNIEDFDEEKSSSEYNHRFCDPVHSDERGGCRIMIHRT
jgi:hypothetical protein